MKVVKTVGSSDFRQNLKANLSLVEGEDVVRVCNRGSVDRILIAEAFLTQLLKGKELAEVEAEEE